MHRPKIIHKVISLSICAAVAVLIFGGLIGQVLASQLSSRSLKISTATVSQTAIYNFSFNIVSSSTLGSISFQFCSNDAVIGDSCTIPTGFSDSSAVLSTQTGQTGFAINGNSTINNLIISRVPSAPVAGPVYYVFTNVTNPSVSGSYFVRILTYSSNNATGSYTDYGGIAFAITSQIVISAEVPPYLLFCTGLSIPNNDCNNANGDFIDFGDLSSSTTASGSSQMLAASNANSGYDISVYGTSMQSGNNVISGLPSPDVSRPGVSQFGLNLRSNNSPAGGQDPSGPGVGSPSTKYDTPNFFSFSSGDIIASSSSPDQDRLYTDDYLVNVSAAQPAGLYDTTLTYICVATF